MILHTIFQWLDPIIHLVGLTISICAFKKCKKKGYLIVATYYALAVFSLVAMPKINRAISQPKDPDPHSELREEMNDEITKVYERYYFEKGLPGETATLKLNFPLGSIILVTGLWLIMKTENKSEPVV